MNHLIEPGTQRKPEWSTPRLTRLTNLAEAELNKFFTTAMETTAMTVQGHVSGGPSS